MNGSAIVERCSLTSGAITIPSTLGGYPVTRIGSNAFSQCSYMSVIIPNSVTRIDDYAFMNCSQLEHVTIPSSVTSLGNRVFEGCHKLNLPWLRAIISLSAMGIGSGDGETIMRDIAKYTLSSQPRDRAIASVYVDGDMAIDSFVLVDGKVYDTALRIVNNSNKNVTVTLPVGYVYETFKGANPLVIPAASTNILTITRTEEKTFLVSREELERVGAK